MFTSHYFPRYFTPRYFNGAGAAAIIFTALVELHLPRRTNWLTLVNRSAELTLQPRSNRLTLPER